MSPNKGKGRAPRERGLSFARFKEFTDQELWALRNGVWLALEEDEADYEVAERLASEVEAEMRERWIDPMEGER